MEVECPSARPCLQIVLLPTVSRTFNARLTVMDVRLSPLIKWPKREELWHRIPMCFQLSLGKKTTEIIGFLVSKETGTASLGE